MYFNKKLVSHVNSRLHVKSVKNSTLSKSDFPGRLFPKNKMIIRKCTKYSPFVPLGLVYTMVVAVFTFKMSSIAGVGFADLREERRFVDWNEGNNIMITLN